MNANTSIMTPTRISSHSHPSTCTSGTSTSNSTNPLWKETQEMNSLTLNALVFDVNASASNKIDWPCSSMLLPPSVTSPTPSTTTSTQGAATTTGVTTTTVNVPQDFASLADAVAFANGEFEKHAGKINLNSKGSVTVPVPVIHTIQIQILIDPRRVPICQVEQPLQVEARKYGHLVIDVLTTGTGTTNSNKSDCEDADETMSCNSDSESSVGRNKRQRKSERASSEAPLKAIVSMETRESNQPLIHHTSGALTLRNLRLDHFSPVDMFQLAKTRSQNTALLLEHGALDSVTAATTEHVAITSFSGRGILNRCHHPTVKVLEHDCFIAKLWSN